MTIFEQKLREIINGHSLESESDTPDFILAEYMIDCLDAFTDATNKREKWCGRKTEQQEANALQPLALGSAASRNRALLGEGGGNAT